MAAKATPESIERGFKNNVQRNELYDLLDICKAYIDLEDPSSFIAVFDKNKVIEKAMRDLCELFAKFPWSLANPVVLQWTSELLEAYENFGYFIKEGNSFPLPIREIKIQGKVDKIHLRIDAITSLVDSVESIEKLEGNGIEMVYGAYTALCSFIGSNLYLLDNTFVFSEIKELVKKSVKDTK